MYTKSVLFRNYQKYPYGVPQKKSVKSGWLADFCLWTLSIITSLNHSFPLTFYFYPDNMPPHTSQALKLDQPSSLVDTIHAQESACPPNGPVTTRVIDWTINI